LTEARLANISNIGIPNYYESYEDKYKNKSV